MNQKVSNCSCNQDLESNCGGVESGVVGEGTDICIHIFLLALPMGLSSSSRTMQTSSIRRTCSSSYPASSLLFVTDEVAADGRTSRASEVSTSGKRLATLSAVILVMVCVALMMGSVVYFQNNKFVFLRLWSSGFGLIYFEQTPLWSGESRQNYSLIYSVVLGICISNVT